MKPDEIVRALKWLAKETEFIFAADQLNAAADLIESLQAENERLAAHGGKYMEIADERYKMYEEAIERAEKAQCQLNAKEAVNQAYSATVSCMRSDLNSTREALTQTQRERDAAVEDLQAFVENPCAVCAHLQNQQYCYQNCQNHDRENYRAWQWRGTQETEG